MDTPAQPLMPPANQSQIPVIPTPPSAPKRRLGRLVLPIVGIVVLLATTVTGVVLVRRNQNIKSGATTLCDNFAHPGEAHCNTQQCQQYTCQADGTWSAPQGTGVCSSNTACNSSAIACPGKGALNQVCRTPQECNNQPACDNGLICEGGICKASGQCNPTGTCLVCDCPQGCANYGGGLYECRPDTPGASCRQVACNQAQIAGSCGQIDFLTNGAYCGVKQQACTGSCATQTPPPSTEPTKTPSPTPTPTLPGKTASPTPTPTKSPTPTPSPTPTNPPDLIARCVEVKAYDTNWVAINPDRLGQLKSGDKVRFTVRGSASEGTITQARFTINGTLRSPVTGVRPGTEAEFFDEYTIPAIPAGQTTLSISVKGEVYHPSFNSWF